jgi:hypothetical protein
VPACSGEALHAALRDALPRAAACARGAPRPEVALSPSELWARGVPAYRLVQEPGSFVVTLPGARSASVDTGFSVSEAARHAPADWLPVATDTLRAARVLGARAPHGFDALLVSLVRSSRRAAAARGPGCGRASGGRSSGSGSGSRKVSGGRGSSSDERGGGSLSDEASSGDSEDSSASGSGVSSSSSSSSSESERSSASSGSSEDTDLEELLAVACGGAEDASSSDLGSGDEGEDWAWLGWRGSGGAGADSAANGCSEAAACGQAGASGPVGSAASGSSSGHGGGVVDGVLPAAGTPGACVCGVAACRCGAHKRRQHEAAGPLAVAVKQEAQECQAAAAEAPHPAATFRACDVPAALVAAAVGELVLRIEDEQRRLAAALRFGVQQVGRLLCLGPAQSH